MHRPIVASIISVTIFTFACYSAAAASSNSPPSGPAAADMAALQNFRLTDDFIARYEAYEEDAAKKPCELSPITALSGDDAQERSLDQTVAAFKAQPGVDATLQRHGLTARETILGMMTLMRAAMQELAQRRPDMVEKGEGSMGAISPANMAVYDRHKDELHQHQRQLAREQLKANGGKLPACLSGG